MDYCICGWHVHSELPLSNALVWLGELGHPAVSITLGIVPDALQDPVYASPFLQIDRQGWGLFELANVGRYLIRDGKEIIIQPKPGVRDTEIRLFLWGTPFGMLCHQRGLFPLRASCVSMGGRAVAFMGTSGVGKSVLATTLVRRGHPLVADEIAVIDLATSGAPMVLPTVPEIHLWQDTLDMLKLPSAHLEQDRPEFQRFALPVEGSATQPTPLAAVFWASHKTSLKQVTFQPMPVLKSVAELASAAYLPEAAKAMGRRSALFLGAGQIGNSISLEKLSFSQSMKHAQTIADLLEGTYAA